MNYTTNLNLPQWEATDQIKRTDFNSAMSAIDTAVAGKASASDVTALQSAMPHIATGSYTGDGVSTGKTITVSFPISAVFVWRNATDNGGGNVWPNAALTISGKSYSYDVIAISGSSFTVKSVSGRYPQLNTSSLEYFYLAVG